MLKEKSKKRPKRPIRYCAKLQAEIEQTIKVPKHCVFAVVSCSPGMLFERYLDVRPGQTLLFKSPCDGYISIEFYSPEAMETKTKEVIEYIKEGFAKYGSKK